MAFEEVTLSEEERAALGSTFFKFSAIGESLAGIFVSKRPSTGQYAKGDDYVFRVKDKATGAIGEVVLSPPTDLAQKLKKADPKPGNKMIMTYTGDLDVQKASPMKQFKLLIDRSASAVPAAAPKPAPKPEDDINF